MNKKNAILLVLSCLIFLISINGANALTYAEYEHLLKTNGNNIPNSAHYNYMVSIDSSILDSKERLKALENDYKKAKKYTEKTKNVKKTKSYKTAVKKINNYNKLFKKQSKLYKKNMNIRDKKLYFAVNMREKDKIYGKYNKIIAKHSRLMGVYERKTIKWKYKRYNLLQTDNYYRHIMKNYHNEKNSLKNEIMNLENLFMKNIK